MIFSPEHIELILQGKKTQTRRAKCKYRVGHAYVLKPGRGKKGMGRIKITGIRQEKLGDITLEDAIKEGASSIESFRQKWISINNQWQPEQEVYVIDFEVQPS